LNQPLGSSGGKELKILVRRSAIERRVAEMGKQITKDFKGRRVHLIGVLKGGATFLCDLIREIGLEVTVDYVAASSYGKGKRSSRRVRLTKDLDSGIRGLNVILVEDILDTGRTVHYLQSVLRKRRPRLLRVAVFLDKTCRRVKPVKADYVGFRIPDEFVVGYGLDYAGRFRNLRDVCVLPPPSR
jgi:hypoxanthine phosphoribosyltransferase